MTLALGDPLPPFALPGVDGSQTTTEGLEGPVVVAVSYTHLTLPTNA